MPMATRWLIRPMMEKQFGKAANFELSIYGLPGSVKTTLAMGWSLFEPRRQKNCQRSITTSFTAAVSHETSQQLGHTINYGPSVTTAPV
ncbi:MAG TPA: hypothetical protein VEQ66_10985 [Propionibacteriaceae bacterium]|nr:hypothetical protein [Propionibacteriaceae bacterium]